jgi:hypothetical protein
MDYFELSMVLDKYSWQIDDYFELSKILDKHS